MDIRICAALALAMGAPAVWAQGWLLTIDVPATAGGQFVAAGEVVQIDDGASAPSPLDAGLPPGVAAGALAKSNEGAICWSPEVPTSLPDGQFARSDDVICHLDGTYTHSFRGRDYGLPRSATITSIGWNEAQELHLSFAVPVSVSGGLVKAGAQVRVDGSSLMPVPDTPALPPRTMRSAASFDEQDRAVLALTTPATLAGVFGKGLVVLTSDAGSVSSDHSIAGLFEDSHRVGLTGLHRLLPDVVEDLLFSDRFETP